LITGGCGFLGSHLARFLLKQDYNVILMDKVLEERLVRDIRNKIVFVQADVTNERQLREVFEKHKVDGVVHYAALLSSAAESDPSLSYKVNFEGVWNVYNAARATEVESLVFASSIAAYGREVLEEAKEDAFTIPETLYGVSKQFGETLGLWFYRKYSMQFVAFRYGSVIGPGRRNGGASAYSTLVVQKPAQGQPCEVNVGQQDMIPLAYVRDVTEITVLAFQNIRRLKSRIYNVASLSPSPTAGELASTVKRHIRGASIVFNPDPAITRMVRSWPRNFDLTRIRNELEWTPRYNNLDALVEDFGREVRQHPELFYI
jgi:nucleoside-diphosphate-sugar epimerase